MFKPKSPCLDCGNRSDTCHADCDRYDKYVKDNELYKSIINESKQEENIGYTLLEQQVVRNNKKYKKGCPWK